MNSVCSFTVVFVLLLGCRCLGQDITRDVATYDVESGANAWEIDSSNGQVFVATQSSGGGSGRVLQLDQRGKMLHEYRLEGIPDSMVIKAGHLVVATRAPNRLQFINLESESIVGSIDFGFSDPTALCDSEVDNPFVYCFSRPRGRPNTFYQIDVSKREVVNQVTLDRWLFDSICDAEMSVDGKRLAIQLGNAVPGSQVAVIDFQEDASVVRSDGLLKRSPGKLNRGWRDREQKAIRVSISSGPESATISDETLFWTPRPGDIGIQEIQLSLSSVDQATQSVGTTLDKRTVMINIAPPNVDLGFPIEAVRVSRNRRRAIAWGGVRERPDPGRPVAGPKNLAVIDLERREVLATKQVPAGIRFAGIDNDFVDLLPAIGQTIYRLDHSLQNPKTTVLQSRSVPSVMQRIAGDRLLVESSQAGNVGTQTLSDVSLAKDVVGIAHDRPLMAVLTKRATHPATKDLIRLQFRGMLAGKTLWEAKLRWATICSRLG